MIPQNTKNNFSEIFTDINSIQRVEELMSALIEPRFFLKDTGISARVLSHWKKNGLLLADDRGVLTWNRFNFLEFILLRIIQRMRTFGVPLKVIKNVNERLNKKIMQNVTPEVHRKMMETVIEYAKNSDFSDEEKQMLINMCSHPDSFQKIREEGQTLLSSFVGNVILKHQEIGFIIYENGEIVEWMDEFTQLDRARIFFERAHIYISITELIFEFLSDRTKEKFIAPYSLLSVRELEVLKRVREKGLREIIIKFPQGKGQDDIHIITKKRVGISNKDEKEICRILGLKNYQSIEIKNNGKNELFIEKTHRKKI